VLASASFFYASAQAQNPGAVTNHAFVLGKGPGTSGYTSLLCGSAQLAVGQAAADPICQTITGDVTLSAAGAVTLATVNSNVGSFGSSTQCVSFTVNAKGLITAASAVTCTPAIASVTGLGTGCATFLATPSSANLRGCLTDEVGTGAAYFVGGALGTPASATLTNATGLPLSGLANQAAYTVVANATGSAAAPTAVSIPALTQKVAPVSADKVMIADSAASDALKYATVSSLASAGSVASIAGNTGAFTLGTGLTNSVNDLRVSLTTATNSLGADVTMVTINVYQDGPSMAQGTSGTWAASGHVTLLDTTVAAKYSCKLWDGTTVIDSGTVIAGATSFHAQIALSGNLASPAGNIRITCKDESSGSGKMIFNASGNSKDSTVSGFRIQ
jgi:hypothetical protein